jgi:hypothetical protein
MKLPSLNSASEGALYSLPVGLTIGLLYRRLTLVSLLISLGLGLIALAMGCNLLITNVIVALTLILSTYYGPEGFNTRTPPTEIASSLRAMKSRKNEGFLSQVTQNILRSGAPGLGMGGPLVEGFEDDAKDEKKNMKPAPVFKDEMAQPFKLGEIPSQMKNGPLIDAGSTLIKAIQGLNPDQINAMTKDTQQLIETQKSLMELSMLQQKHL